MYVCVYEFMYVKEPSRQSREISDIITQTARAYAFKLNTTNI